VVDTLPKLLRNCPRVSALLLGNWTFSMKSVFLVLVLLALLAATLWWSVYAWNSVDVEMSIHGYIAMILGIVFSLVIGCGPANLGD
jgi:fatty acid desaturase